MARRKRSNTGIPGLSFSWKRALGVTSAKRKFSQATGIPATKAGRRRKIRRMASGGCLGTMLVCVLSIFVTASLLVSFV